MSAPGAASRFQSILSVLTENVHPLSVRGISRKTGIQRKFVRAIMRHERNAGTVVCVEPELIGSGKFNHRLYTHPSNQLYVNTTQQLIKILIKILLIEI